MSFTNRLLNFFFSLLDSAARKTKFIVRNSYNFFDAGYLLSLPNATLTGKASINQLAITLKDSEPLSLSKQAVWKRINSLAVAFMLEALAFALLEKWHCCGPQIPKLKKYFKRIFIEDSPHQKLLKSGHDLFPAYGNGQSVTAGMKVDLINRHTVSSCLQGATE